MANAKWSKEQHQKFRATVERKKAQVVAKALENHALKQKMADAAAAPNKAEGPQSTTRALILPISRRAAPRYPARLAIYGKRVTIAPDGTVTVEDYKT